MLLTPDAMSCKLAMWDLAATLGSQGTLVHGQLGTCKTMFHDGRASDLSTKRRPWTLLVDLQSFPWRQHFDRMSVDSSPAPGEPRQIQKRRV